MSRLTYARRYFPELRGETIKVGLTKSASGMAVPGSNEVWLNPTHVSYHTIAHELVHLLQGRAAGIPQGERSCDVFSLARHWTLNDVCPSYVRIPRVLMDTRGMLTAEAAMLVYDVASDAVRRRHTGMRDYVNFFESTLGERAAPMTSDGIV
ncbi:MAG: hypothetical protein IH969_00705 [Candidatus Krumholzibacteriota bacterium]|nr:hypothetical protein [Candidatus Krumholzibacteriota bacterium]